MLASISSGVNHHCMHNTQATMWEEEGHPAKKVVGGGIMGVAGDYV